MEKSDSIPEAIKLLFADANAKFPAALVFLYPEPPGYMLRLEFTKDFIFERIIGSEGDYPEYQSKLNRYRLLDEVERQAKEALWEELASGEGGGKNRYRPEQGGHIFDKSGEFITSIYCNVARVVDQQIAEWIVLGQNGLMYYIKHTAYWEEVDVAEKPRKPELVKAGGTEYPVTFTAWYESIE